MNIYGAGGHAKVISGICTTNRITIDNYIDDNPDLQEFQGFDVKHTVTGKMKTIPTIFAVGNNKRRKKLVENFEGMVSNYVSNTSAVISPTANVGEGTVIMANAVINADASIGKHCIINTGAVVEHDNIIQDYSHISPNASLAGKVIIGEGAHVGIGACVKEGVTIGKWSVVGAGCVVIENVPNYAVVVGNPASLLRKEEE